MLRYVNTLFLWPTRNVLQVLSDASRWENFLMWLIYVTKFIRRIVGCVWVYMQKMELSYWWEHGDEKNKNKLGEWRAFADTVGIKSEHMAVCDLPYN